MNEKSPTYEELYSLLKSLGFDEGPPGKSPEEPRVFRHAESDTILAFGRDAGEAVTPADLLSADVHLQGKWVVDQPLESLLQAHAVGR